MVFLLRYDTEASDWPDHEMNGFLETAVAVHRQHKIPVSFFCTGAALNARREEFADFAQEIAGDPLFHVGDHSFSHISPLYEKGPALDVLKDDYQRSFEVHEDIFGASPEALSLCGCSGFGDKVSGFDAGGEHLNALHMFAEMGVKILNARLSNVRSKVEFTSFESLGYPEIMGYPTDHSDTNWLIKAPNGDPLPYLRKIVNENADANEHLPVICHDWAAWCHAPDKRLSHVVQVAKWAEEAGYELKHHGDCYRSTDLWQKQTHSAP